MGSSGHPYRTAHAVAVLVLFTIHRKVPSSVAVPLHPTHSNTVEYDGTSRAVELMHLPLPAELERSRQPAQTVPGEQATEAFLGVHQEGEGEEEVVFVAVNIAKKFQINRSTSVCTFGSGNEGSAEGEKVQKKVQKNNAL
jgi:hypothetical protein